MNSCDLTDCGSGNQMDAVSPSQPKSKTGRVATLCKHLKSGTIARRIVSGAFWSLVGAASSRAMMLLTSIFVARHLGARAFGELGIVQNTATVFQVLAAFSLGVTATKHVSGFRKSHPERAGGIIAISNMVAIGAGLVIAVALLILAPWIAGSLFSSPGVKNLLRLACVYLFMSCLNASQTGSLAGLERFRTLSIINFGSGVLTLILTICSLRFWGTAGVILAMGIGMTANCVLNSIAVRHAIKQDKIRTSIRCGLRELRMLWEFSLPAALSSALVMPANWLCMAFLSHSQNGLSELGIFNAANQWFSVAIFLPTVLGQALLPVISESIGTGEDKLAKRVLRLSAAVNAGISLPLFAIGVLASRWILGAYGPGFEKSGNVLAFLLASATLVCIEMPVGDLLVASGRMWLGFVMNLGWALTVITASYLLVHLGALGLAEARLLAYAVHLIWTAAFAFRFLHRVKKPSPAISRDCDEQLVMI